MTYEEAKESLEEVYEELQKLYGKYPYAEIQEMLLEGVNFGIDALEKQIPKKVIFEPKAEFLRYCPNCNVRFIAYGHPYCSECGQSLDWGSEK